MREYDLIADWYVADRDRTIGVPEALAVAATLPGGAGILDLGCGTGVPITAALVNAGHHAVGLDTSPRMLEKFRTNLPATAAVRGDARACPFRDGTFDAVISWGMLFHLTRDDQHRAIGSVSRVLKPGSPFLFTAAEITDADENGITGTMNEVTFHYYAVPSYASLLAVHGLTLVNVHDDPGVSTYYLARKTA
jgi:ubiquinone/menaquinone biosynthesis C-methylase UbiE